MVFFLFAASFLLAALNTLLSKKASDTTSTQGKQMIYFFVMGIFAMVNFLVLSKFSISFTKINFFYGIIYAFCVLFSISTNFITLRYTTIPFKLVFGGALSLLLNQLISLWAFGEPLLTSNIIRCILRIISAIFIVSPKALLHCGKSLKSGIFWCMVNAAVGGITTYVTKQGATEAALDTNSWFFLTNLFVTLFSVIYLIIGVLFLNINCRSELGKFGKRGTIIAFLSALDSNVSSLISVKLIALVPLSYYSPVSGALAMIASFVVSRFVLREPAGLNTYIALLLSIIAVII